MQTEMESTNDSYRFAKSSIDTRRDFIRPNHLQTKMTSQSPAADDIRMNIVKSPLIKYGLKGIVPISDSPIKLKSSF